MNTFELTVDDVWPRDRSHRWRIYRLRRGQLDVVRATGSLEGIGLAIASAREEGDLKNTDAVGVLDVTVGLDEPPDSGTWLVNPFCGGKR